MSLRLNTEDAFSALLEASASKPAGYVVQAGHRIADLQLPAVIVHADSSSPVVEGSSGLERKVTMQCTIMTPVDASSAVTAHRAAFSWLNTALSSVTAVSVVTFMGGYFGSEQSGSNDKVMEDSLQYTAFVRP